MPDRLFYFIIQIRDFFLRHSVAVIFHPDSDIFLIQKSSFKINFVIPAAGVEAVDKIVFYQQLEDIPDNTVFQKGGINVVAESHQVAVPCDEQGQVFFAEGQLLPEGDKCFSTYKASENGSQVGDQFRGFGVSVAVAFVAQHFQGII